MTTRAPVLGEDIDVQWPVALMIVGVAFGALFVANMEPAAAAAPRSMGVPGPAAAVVATAAPTATAAASVHAEAAPSAIVSAASASVTAAASVLASPPSACRSLTIEFNSATVTPPAAALAPLQTLAALLGSNRRAALRIDGHADARGDETENLLLSRRRADAIAAVLTQAGVERERITVHAFGALQPVDGVDETNAAQRRVVVTLRGVDHCPNDLPETVSP